MRGQTWFQTWHITFPHVDPGNILCLIAGYFNCFNDLHRLSETQCMPKSHLPAATRIMSPGAAVAIAAPMVLKLPGVLLALATDSTFRMVTCRLDHESKVMATFMWAHCRHFQSYRQSVIPSPVSLVMIWGLGFRFFNPKPCILSSEPCHDMASLNLSVLPVVKHSCDLLSHLMYCIVGCTYAVHSERGSTELAED